ncbi:MAG: hypothetical protein GYA33_12075 [Thermogutta sp.]|nr:hypothetical protein [Thermogutta sp.]
MRAGRLAAAAVIGGLVATTCFPAWGQFNPMQGPMQAPMQGPMQGPMRRPQEGPRGALPMAQAQRIEASGIVEAVSPQGIRILSPTGQPWELVPAKGCKLTLTGKAMPDVLRPGMFVLFTAEVEKRTGTVAEPVAALIICSADQKHMPGVFPEGTRPSEGGEGGANVQGMPGGVPGGLPGGLPGGGFGGPLGGEQSTNPRRRPPRQPRGLPDSPPSERFEICGRITNIAKTGGKITVAVPNQYIRAPITFELAENADISLELSGQEAAPLIRKGARVEGKGTQIGPSAARISELNVELVEPLTFAEPRKAAAGREAPRARERTRAADHEGEEKAPAAENAENQAEPPAAAEGAAEGAAEAAAEAAAEGEK